MASRQLDEEAIFHVARRISDADAQSKYLDQICAGDRALRERVEALLQVHEQEQDFLKSSPEPAPTVDQPSISEGPGVEIGRYKLLEKIGEGGFGVVYMAEQPRPVRRKVALKIIKPGMDSKEVIARFEAERQALALMDHPNIARVFDGGTTESGRPYFVMELIHGIPITEFCEANDLTLPERLELFVSVCQAVQHAHQKGIIHRDLKPSNILVTQYDHAPLVKVIDFGVAKALGQPLTERTLFTRFAQIVGTPLYMSPEQAELRAVDVDTRTDIYSLGVLLYELLTGRAPFDPKRLREAAFDEIRRIVREEEPPKPSTKIKSLGQTATAVAQHRKTDARRLVIALQKDLDWIVMKALDKDRTRRYQTAKDLGDDLHRHMEHKPVEAGPPSRVYRLSKFIKRHKGQVAVAVAITATLVLAAVFTIRNERQKARWHEQAFLAEEKGRKEADGAAARATLDQGLHESEWGDEYGMVRLARACEFAQKADDKDLEVHIRRQLGAWAGEAHELQRVGGKCPIHHTSQSAKVSPDTTIAASVDINGTLRVWNTQTGDPVGEGLKLDRSVKYRLETISPDNKLLALSCTPPNESSRVLVFEIASGQPACDPMQLPAIPGPYDFIAQFSPDNRFLAIGHSSQIHLWDTATWTLIASTDDEHRFVEIGAIAFSLDGRFMATRRGNHWMLWDTSHGLENLGRVRYPGNPVSAAFTPDGKRLALGGDSGVQFWNTSTLKPSAPYIQYGTKILHLAFSRDGTLLLTVDPSSAQVWEASSGLPIGPRMSQNAIGGAVFNSDASTVFTISGTKISLPFQVNTELVRAWQVNRGVTSKEITLPKSPRKSDFAKSGRRAVFASGDGRALVVETVHGGPVGQPIEHEGVPLVAISSNGRTVATAYKGVMRVFDFDKGGEQVGQSIVHDARVVTLVVSDDGEVVAAGCDNDTIHVFDVTPEIVCRRLSFSHPKRLMPHIYESSIRFSPCNEFLLTSCAQGMARLWDAESGVPSGKPWQHPELITAMAFSGDGSRVALAGLETCTVWDVQTGELAGPPLKHEGEITSVALSRDGELAATAGWFSCSVKVWDVTQGRSIGPAMRRNLGVRWVGFADQDHAIQFMSYVVKRGHTETTLFTRPLPLAFEGDYGAIQRLVEAKTGVTLESHGVVRQLTVDEWNERRKDTQAVDRNEAEMDP